MKNILTIDFDIVMAPCIELYNNMVKYKYITEEEYAEWKIEILR